MVDFLSGITEKLQRSGKPDCLLTWPTCSATVLGHHFYSTIEHWQLLRPCTVISVGLHVKRWCRPFVGGGDGYQCVIASRWWITLCGWMKAYFLHRCVLYYSVSQKKHPRHF